MIISSTFVLFAFYFTVCFWRLFIVENGEEAEKKNSPKLMKSSHPETWNSGLKGFQKTFAGSQPPTVFAKESNFSVVIFCHSSFLPDSSQYYQYHPAFLLHRRQSSLCSTTGHLCKSNQMFLLGLRAFFSWLPAQGQSDGVRHPNAKPLFNNTMSGQFLPTCCFPSSWLHHFVIMMTNSYNYLCEFAVIPWGEVSSFEGGQSCILSGWILMLYFRELQISIYSFYSSYAFNQRCSWQRILRSGRICTPFPHYLIHATSADLQIHILLSSYDMTLSQTVFRLFPLLLCHSLCLATLPSHAVICVLSSFSQSTYKNLTRSGVTPCEDLSSACRILSPRSKESLDILISLIMFKTVTAVVVKYKDIDAVW